MHAYPLLLLIFSLPVCADTIYQCRDAKGRVTLQDMPCGVSATDRMVRSGQDEAREKYLAAGGDANLSYARGVTHKGSCVLLFDAYRSARRTADAAASRGNLLEMQQANAGVSRVGKAIADQGC
ncbi:DUF4124 domain-containing protein [Cupriavidus taiwanensis]|uniref:DUF4124 domain-containing protein n=1 Tax=Cupriavidus taiwanensis TaxID=164546 RepID=UPI000E2F9A69